MMDDPTDIFLDKLNPDLTQEIGRCLEHLEHPDSLAHVDTLKKMFMRMYRLGKNHGFESAMQIIREAQR